MRTTLHYRTKVVRLPSGNHHWQIFDFSGAVYDAGKAKTQRKARAAVRAAKSKLITP